MHRTFNVPNDPDLTLKATFQVAKVTRPVFTWIQADDLRIRNTIPRDHQAIVIQPVQQLLTARSEVLVSYGGHSIASDTVARLAASAK